MKCKRFIIAIGMNDSLTLKQEKSKEEIIKTICSCCRKYNLPFSCGYGLGGYVNNANEYVEEHHVLLSIIDPEDENAVKLAVKDICIELNQECISVTIDEVDRYMVTR